MCFTSRAELFAGLKNEDAYDTIDKFDFDIHDVIPPFTGVVVQGESGSYRFNRNDDHNIAHIEDNMLDGSLERIEDLAHNEKMRGNEINKVDLACSFQNVVVDVLLKKTLRCLNVKDLKILKLFINLSFILLILKVLSGNI